MLSRSDRWRRSQEREVGPDRPTQSMPCAESCGVWRDSSLLPTRKHTASRMHAFPLRPPPYYFGFEPFASTGVEPPERWFQFGSVNLKTHEAINIYHPICRICSIRFRGYCAVAISFARVVASGKRQDGRAEERVSEAAKRRRQQSEKSTGDSHS